MVRTGRWGWCRARITWRGCCDDLKGWVEHAFNDLEERFGFPALGRTTAIEEDGARLRGARDCAQRDEVGRTRYLPPGDHQRVGQAGPDGHDFPHRVRRRR